MEVNERKKLIYRATLMGSLINFVLVIVKIAAGVLGRSSAMLADGIHSLSDFITDIVVLFFVKLSSKPSDLDHQYGHGKYETLATAFVGIAIFIVGLGILVDAIEKIIGFFKGDIIAQPSFIALIAAALSIIIKEILYHYTKRIGKKTDSSLVLANAWHHRSDAFSSIGTLVGITGAYFLGSSWTILDPIAAALVSLFIFKVAIELLLPSINDLLEIALPEEVQEDILILISSVEDVKDPHNLRTRRIGNDFAIELHIRLNPNMTVQKSHDISTKIEYLLRQEYGHNTHVAIHIEPSKEH